MCECTLVPTVLSEIGRWALKGSLQSPVARSALLSASQCASFKEVEHSCKQCGSLIEDGRPFCAQCRAPQIHVSVAPAELSFPSDNILPEDSGDLAPVEARLPSIDIRRPASRNILDRRAATHAAIKAGVLGVFIGAIPFLGIVLTGYLAVFFYRRENGSVPLAALASRVGGSAGVVAFSINALLMTIRVFVLHGQQYYIDFLTQLANKFGEDASDPKFQAALHALATPAGLAATLLFGVIIAGMMASVGGALASVFLKPANKE
jgi:hypothetical protein